MSRILAGEQPGGEGPADVRLRFGRCIRLRREELGFSQETLGLRAGLHPTYVSGIERGRRNVSFDNIIKLCTALSVLPSDLFLRCKL